MQIGLIGVLATLECIVWVVAESKVLLRLSRYLVWRWLEASL